MSSFADNALRTFENQFAPLLKGVSLTTVAPLILIGLVLFFIFKVFFADSPYGPFARSLALTASNVWEKRHQYGFAPSVNGRSLETLEPLTEVLDALSHTVKKYELEVTNAFPRQSSKVRFQ